MNTKKLLLCATITLLFPLQQEISASGWFNTWPKRIGAAFLVSGGVYALYRTLSKKTVLVRNNTQENLDSKSLPDLTDNKSKSHATETSKLLNYLNDCKKNYSNDLKTIQNKFNDLAQQFATKIDEKLKTLSTRLSSLELTTNKLKAQKTKTIIKPLDEKIVKEIVDLKNDDAFKLACKEIKEFTEEFRKSPTSSDDSWSVFDKENNEMVEIKGYWKARDYYANKIDVILEKFSEAELKRFLLERYSNELPDTIRNKYSIQMRYYEICDMIEKFCENPKDLLSQDKRSEESSCHTCISSRFFAKNTDLQHLHHILRCSKKSPLSTSLNSQKVLEYKNHGVLSLTENLTKKYSQSKDTKTSFDRALGIYNMFTQTIYRTTNTTLPSKEQK